MKHKYHEGPKALKNFEDGMKKLFQAPKPAKSPFKPPPAKPNLPARTRESLHKFWVRGLID